MTHAQIPNATGGTGPGALHGRASVLIQTFDARRIVVGRRRSQDGKASIVGLIEFGSRVRKIWDAAAKDDPYADWYLVRIEEAIHRARTRIGRELALMRNHLESVPEGIEIAMVSSKGTRIPLTFACPYGYMAVYLVADYDLLVRQVRTALRHGLIGSGEGRVVIIRGAKWIRSVFALVTQWHHLDITRAAVRQGTRQAQMAEAIMGVLPEAVMAGKQRAKQAPKLTVVPVDAPGPRNLDLFRDKTA